MAVVDVPAVQPGQAEFDVVAEHAGETVQFRFRVATDASTGRVPDGFYLDDFRIQSCTSNDLIFAHGFE